MCIKQMKYFNLLLLLSFYYGFSSVVPPCSPAVCTTRNQNNYSNLKVNLFSVDAPRSCYTAIIFDLSSNITSEEIFEISVKNYLYYALGWCGTMKFIFSSKNNVTLCQKGCQEFVEKINYENIILNYDVDLLNNDAADLEELFNNTLSLMCPCENNSIILLTNRIVDIRKFVAVNQELYHSCSTLTAILLGRNVNNASNIMANIYNTNITNSFYIPNFDCLSYLFYCLSPCGALNCLQSDLSSCFTTSKLSPNKYPNETLFVWYVIAFMKSTPKEDYAILFANIRDSLANFTIVNNIDKMRITAVTMEQGPAKHVPMENMDDFWKWLSFEEGYIIDYGVNIPAHVGNDFGAMKTLLGFVPWGGSSGSLGPKRIGTQSIIILTNYAPTVFNIYNDEGQTLEGTLYVYNIDAYKQYRDMINDSSLLKIINSNYSDPIFVKLNQTTMLTTTTESLETGTPPISRVMTTSRDVPTTTRSAKKSGNVLTVVQILVISGSVFTILVFFIVGFAYYRRRKQWRKSVNRLQVLKRSTKGNFQSTETTYDKWELEWENLVVRDDNLGAGAYGNILQAQLLNDTRQEIHEESCDVAIKMTNKFADKNALDRFLAEINLMKQISGQKNIVKMIGCITTGDRICLVLEFCANLDLLKYVKNEAKIEENKRRLKKEFIMFAWQISHGLITDFGLSIQQNKNIKKQYITSGHGKLPIKWLAIESLKNQEFSFKTDIWTFGIMLYEMYSYGEVPYSDIYVTELLAYLEEGNRIKKPEDCPDEIYALMSKCWMQNPSERPTVDELIKGFTTHLKHSTEEYGYLDLLENSNNKKIKKRFIQRFTSTESSSSYV